MLPDTPWNRLVQVASRLQSLEQIADRDRLDELQITKLLEANRVALENSKQLIGPDCKRTISFELPYWETHRNQTDVLRKLFFFLEWEAKKQVAAHEYASAIKNAGHIFDLSNIVRRGGLVVDALVSTSITARAINLLRLVRTKFSHSERDLLYQLLARVLMEQEDFASILVRDRHWDERVTNLEQPSPFEDELLAIAGNELTKKQIETICDEMTRLNNLPSSEQQELYRKIDNCELARLRMLAVDLLLRSLYDTHGQYPESLDGLTASASEDLVTDPYTSKRFCYRQKNDGRDFTLYSTGPSQMDSGGRFGNWPEVLNLGLDLCLDADDYSSACTLTDLRENSVFTHLGGAAVGILTKLRRRFQ